MVGDARAYGRLHDVSVADIQAALEAGGAKHHDKIYEIEIVSADEIRLYLQPRVDPTGVYDIIRRVNGKWRFVFREVIVG
jgi:hypothetical protein